ncbi:MAG: S8 family serine peptidase [Kiritimatiellae bacterium]|nr:S8 family serine peptidase [Kiritimatiellia bacterium]
MSNKISRHTGNTLPKGIRPYDWALRQLHVEQAHAVTRGSKKIIVAIIDLGYRHHPDVDGHLWRNPHPCRGDLHGWDFADNDASLEYRGANAETSDYFRGHHVFIAGEVAAVAPKCPIMILRVGYARGQARSWVQAVRYAVDHGARVIVEPHGYIQGQAVFGGELFSQGTDLGYPFDNTELLEADDYAYRHGVPIVKGVCDNRGRRVAAAKCARPPVFAVGTSNRKELPANICANADYVAVGAPGGERGTHDPHDRIWGCGGDRNYIPFEGGCMAGGFAGGVAALALSRFPHLTVDELRQVLCNTARGQGWNSWLGHGILDAARAVSLQRDELDARLVVQRTAHIQTADGKTFVRVTVANRGALDLGRVLVTLYTGHPRQRPKRSARRDNPWKMGTLQIGHAVVERICGFEAATVPVEIINYNRTSPREVWAEACALEVGRSHQAECCQLRPACGSWAMLPKGAVPGV